MALTLNDPALGILGGVDERFAENSIEDRGRAITIDWQQAGANQDLELYGYSIRFYAGEEQPEDSEFFSGPLTSGVAYGSGYYGDGIYGFQALSVIGTFTLDLSTLGELTLDAAENPFSDRGRSIQIEWSQSGTDQDMELHGYSIRFHPAEEQSLEVL